LGVSYITRMGVCPRVRVRKTFNIMGARGLDAVRLCGRELWEPTHLARTWYDAHWCPWNVSGKGGRLREFEGAEFGINYFTPYGGRAPVPVPNTSCGRRVLETCKNSRPRNRAVSKLTVVLEFDDNTDLYIR
jgi:hypothetical protein